MKGSQAHKLVISFVWNRTHWPGVQRPWTQKLLRHKTSLSLSQGLSKKTLRINWTGEKLQLFWQHFMMNEKSGKKVFLLLLVRSFVCASFCRAHRASVERTELPASFFQSLSFSTSCCQLHFETSPLQSDCITWLLGAHLESEIAINQVKHQEELDLLSWLRSRSSSSRGLSKPRCD